ncbi:s-adenosylmethionine-dependent methyltransferase [Ophiostoma piceae UAMH 11346]|uniref:Protein-lysine N-methyltransferase EFM4 n=1 Tax=Ophiostoma piceae (strain UAMH 11346) TaxID=1262450 RepID=S3C3H6_OPHP1|nr:s-adenosylmethionine-dependent methyltransferase [Ophiostoma piceae UAMH 11346]
MPPSKPAHLEPSELGTKEYWDNLYKTEIANHANNPDDKGTVWFDDSDAEAKMAQFLADLDTEGALNANQVLDLGCGNGSLLRAVRDELWADGVEEQDGSGAAVRLLGVDYSESSVKLAKSIEENDEDSEHNVPISFSVWDMLEGSASDLLEDGEAKDKTDAAACWDLILDKGTFDAISLGNAQNTTDAAGAPRTPVEIRYRRQILNLLRAGGKFLITSCNWTEPELCAWMVDDEEEEGAAALPYKLFKAGRVAYPSFQFGGVQGQTVCTVCFEKRSRP